MITILTEKDLTFTTQSLVLEDVRITDIRESFEPIKRSSLVILRIGENIRVLKDKYVSHDDGAVYNHLATQLIISEHLQRLHSKD